MAGRDKQEKLSIALFVIISTSFLLLSVAGEIGKKEQTDSERQKANELLQGLLKGLKNNSTHHLHDRNQKRTIVSGISHPNLGADDWVPSGSFRCDQLVGQSDWSSCLQWRSDTTLFYSRIKNPYYWKCGMCMLVWGYGRSRGWVPDDPYNFKLVDAQMYYGDSGVKKHAQNAYLYKPNGCLGANPAIEWCDVLNYWRAWNRYTNDYYIPYCRQSLCWFQPGVECLARIGRWTNLASYQQQMVINRGDWNLVNYLQSIVPPNGNIVTRCFGKDQIARLPCPLGTCSLVKKRGDLTRPINRLMRLLKKDTKQSTRGYCPSTYDCANCQTPSASGNCIGSDPWGNRLCCDCLAEQAYAEFL